MSFEFRHLRRLGNRLAIQMPKDEDGFLGRECPSRQCLGYFKIKPGTGLTGKDLPCHCPYCGHSSSHDQFWTREQIAYAKSVGLRQITDAVRKDLQSLEFEQKPRGSFGVGLSLKLQPGRPVPIHYYREKSLETNITCGACTLEYAVFGVFAYCPDCGVHNSLQILQQNLSLVLKQIALAQMQDDADLRRHLIEDALENCVSAFDGFARETCRTHAEKSSDPEKCAALSFQNLPRATNRLKALFGIDLQGTLLPEDWRTVHIGFMRRHLLAHRSGVVDQQYVNESGDSASVPGRRILVNIADVERIAKIVGDLGQKLVTLLP